MNRKLFDKNLKMYTLRSCSGYGRMNFKNNDKYLIGIVLWFIALLQMAQSLDIETCKNPLGMESGSIADFQITASSAHDMGNVGPQHARLKIDNNGGAWCPKHMVSRGLKEYLQIDLLKVHVITAVRTQGRFGKGQGQEYTESYVLEYWRPGMTKWIRWKNIQGKEVLPGNINTYSEVENLLQPIIFASKIRIYPYSQYDRTVCMRAEVVGCPWEEGIVSYTIPKGVQRGIEIDLSDKTYDGHEEEDKYVGGLGQLVDGQKGKDNFRTDIHGFGKGYEWVGWRNDTPNLLGKPVEIVFEFETVRNFSSIILHTNNMFSKDVQVFVHAKVYFSMGGRHYTGQPVLFSYMPDTVLDHARDVTIKLHHRMGRFLRVRLYFALRWIMLSEISFVSAPMKGNFTEEEIPETTPPQEIPYQRDGTQSKYDKNNRTPKVIAPKPIDQEQEEGFVGVIIGVLTTIILLLVAVILLIIARNKRKAARGSNVLDVFQHNFHSDALGSVGGVKRMHHGSSNIKVGMDDSDSMDKNSMYHEPFNVNMYTSAASACSMNDMRHHHIAPDYTEVSDAVCQEYIAPHMQNFIPKTSGGYVNVRTRPPQSLNNIFPTPPPVPARPTESYYAATAIYRPISNGSGNGSIGGNLNGNVTGFSTPTGTLDSNSTIPEMSIYFQPTSRIYNFKKFPENL